MFRTVYFYLFIYLLGYLVDAVKEASFLSNACHCPVFIWHRCCGSVNHLCGSLMKLLIRARIDWVLESLLFDCLVLLVMVVLMSFDLAGMGFDGMKEICPFFVA